MGNSNDYGELVGRLQQEPPPYNTFALRDEAADAITALQRRAETAEAVVEAARGLHTNYTPDSADINRLTDALDRLDKGARP